MSESNLQNQYNQICLKLGETEYRLAALQQEKLNLIRQAGEIQKAWATIKANAVETEGHESK